MAVALIVDDDASVRQLLRIILQKEGITVDEATNGREALRRIGARDFDLIVLDLAMPFMDGLELLDRLARTAPVRQNVIVLSAVNRKDLRQINPAAVYSVVRKPFDVYDLAAHARRVIERSEAVHSMFWDMLDEALRAQRTQMGDVQLLDSASGGLHIVAHRGVGTDFLDHFRIVRPDGGSACARALRAAQPIVVEDTRDDEVFVPHRTIADSTGFRSIISLPLVRREGSVFGMLSTLFSAPRRFTHAEMTDLQEFSRHVSAKLQPLADAGRVPAI